MYDLILENGTVADGTGNSCYKSNICINKDKIVAVNNKKSSAREVININGLIVSPGFIDFHAHSDLSIIADPSVKDKIMQGITTQVIGNCGFSVAPINKKYKNTWREYIGEIVGSYNTNWNWCSMKEYLEEVKKGGVSTNVIPLAGYGAIRICAIGMENKKLSTEDIVSLEKLTCKIMEEGAFGVSFGLIYFPIIYSKLEEIKNICKIVSRYDRLVAFHMRNEGDYLLDSINEIIEIAQECRCKVEISHFKAMGERNWGDKVEKGLDILEKANKNGLNIGIDQYPYTAASTYLQSFLPPWVIEGGTRLMLNRLKDVKLREKIKDEFKTPPLKQSNWDNFASLINNDWEKVVINGVYSSKNKDIQGLNLAESAKVRNKSPEDTLFDLLIEENGKVSTIIFLMSEKDVMEIMKSPLQVIGSDGLYGKNPHPRSFGTFPRILGYYVRDKKLLSLEYAINKMTLAPAKRIGINNRGIIQKGAYADIVVFDFNKIKDTSTYREPYQYPEGIEYVLVNGKIIIGNKKDNNIKLAGKVLKR